MGQADSVRFWSVVSGPSGAVPYADAHRLQLELVELRSQDLIPDTVLFIEHPPTITRGRGLQLRSSGSAAPSGMRHFPIALPLPPGLELHEVERGGDLTVHEPGQLVVYPICKLGSGKLGPRRDVVAFLRKIELAVIAVLARAGVDAVSREGAAGVWVESGDRKIASLGIAVRKWVTFHGLALNAVNSLETFKLISPCGFSSEVMTRLKDQIPVEEKAATEAAREAAKALAHPTAWRPWLELELIRALGEQAHVRRLPLDGVLGAAQKREGPDPAKDPGPLFS